MNDDLERLRGEDPELADKLELLLAWASAAKQERENEALLRLDTEADEPAPKFLYQPDTAHPAYAKQANMVRRFMSEGLRAIRLPKPIPISAIFTLDPYPIGPAMFDVDMLEVKRAAGPAPYVGQPFIYTWEVAMDKQGRWVSGPTRMRHI